MKFFQHNPEEGIGGVGSWIEHYLFAVLQTPFIG